ncbi:TBC1 domain family member 10A-like [Oscarella lobularis]|uniref:TBC1 domain family member 10A-like n=1 Tax=Oscarella lobularis TaxID=121494 RepID=UPI0033136AD3
MEDMPTDRFGFYRPNKDDLYRGISVPNVDQIRKRESKWRKMLDTWNSYMKANHKKVKERCRKGIPQSLRGIAYQHLTGSRERLVENPNLYQQLVSTDDADCPWLESIDKDLHRTFPQHFLFRTSKGQGQSELRDVLKAYSLYDTNIGFCQPMAPIVATLLMHMPDEQAFWCLVVICQKYLIGYYSPGLEGIKSDSKLFGRLLKLYFPQISKHLIKNGADDPLLYMCEWFTCIYCRSLPWNIVLRILDMFFCEGVKVLFKVGFTILNIALGSPQKRERCSDLLNIITTLKSPPEALLQEDIFFLELNQLKIKDGDFVREHLAIALH